jgi:plastocyanin
VEELPVSRRLISLVSILALAAALLASAAVSLGKGESSPTVTIGKNNDYAFKPGHLRVKRGTRVHFVWAKSNGAPHNVHIKRAPRGVKHITKGGRNGKQHGRPVGITFRKVGTYKLDCTIHPFMTVKIKVHR